MCSFQICLRVFVFVSLFLSPNPAIAVGRLFVYSNEIIDGPRPGGGVLFLASDSLFLTPTQLGLQSSMVPPWVKSPLLM